MKRKRYDLHARMRTHLATLFGMALMFLLAAGQPAAAQKTILFIYNQGQNTGDTEASGRVLNEDEQYLNIIADQLGYNVVLIDQNQVTPEDTVGVDAVFISETVGSGTVVDRFVRPMTGDDQFANLSIPVIAAEVFVWDDFHWIKTGDGFGVDQAWGFARSEKLNILQSDHPILGGLRQGPVTVFDAPGPGEDRNQTGYGVPKESADIIAAVSGMALFNNMPIPSFPETRASIFVYEEGDALIDSDTLDVNARARRVGLFAHTHGGENMSEVGAALVRNAIAWAVGDEAQMVDITADPAKILFVYNPDENTGAARDNGSIRDEDFLYLTLLQDSLGFEPVLVGQNQVTPADTAGVEAIFLSESVGSGTVVDAFIRPMEGAAEFGNIGIPVVTPEVFLWDDMFWMKTGDDYGVDVARGFSDADSINVEAEVHPIINGLAPGPVRVYNDPPTGEDVNQVGYAVPMESATILATIAASTNRGGVPLPEFNEPRATLFVYEVGDTLVSSDTLEVVARSRRAAFFAHTRGGENLTEAGQILFMNTMLWATGRESEARTDFPETGTAIESPNGELPTEMAIESIYPNPFNPSATALVRVQSAGSYEVRVFDALGRVVQRQLLQVGAPGAMQVSLEMQNQASGIYFIQVQHRETGKTAMGRAVLMK